MEDGKLFPELVKFLSEDENVFGEIKRFVDALGIPWTKVKPFMNRYELCQKDPDVLIRRILSEWIKLKGDSATLAELRGILKECELVATSGKN